MGIALIIVALAGIATVTFQEFANFRRDRLIQSLKHFMTHAKATHYIEINTGDSDTRNEHLLFDLILTAKDTHVQTRVVITLGKNRTCLVQYTIVGFEPMNLKLRLRSDLTLDPVSSVQLSGLLEKL